MKWENFCNKRTHNGKVSFCSGFVIKNQRRQNLYTLSVTLWSDVSGVIPEPVFLNVHGAQESIPRMNSASLCSLAVRYDNPIPTRFLAPIDCLKIPALDACDLDDSYSITSLPTYVPPLIRGLLAQWAKQLSADRPVLPTITTIFRPLYSKNSLRFVHYSETYKMGARAV